MNINTKKLVFIPAELAKRLIEVLEDNQFEEAEGTSYNNEPIIEVLRWLRIELKGKIL